MFDYQLSLLPFLLHRHIVYYVSISPSLSLALRQFQLPSPLLPDSLTHTRSLSRLHKLSFSLSLSLSLTLTLALSLTHTHTQTPYSSRFASIAWSEMATNPTFSYGLIAGGMNDGYVHVWDPSKLASGEPEELIASVEQHQGTHKIML